jgi:hypothetical protein
MSAQSNEAPVPFALRLFVHSEVLQSYFSMYMKMSTYFNSLLTRARRRYLGEEEWVQASETQTVFAHALVSIIRVVHIH